MNLTFSRICLCRKVFSASYTLNSLSAGNWETIKCGNSKYNARNYSFRKVQPKYKLRHYCTFPKERAMPRLMDFPEIVWPSIFKSIKNWIFINFIIRPYFDNEFQISDFVCGAKQALTVISSKLVKGDFDSLKDLVTQNAIDELKPIIQKLSISQRRQLEVIDNDVYLSFPYEVGIMFDDKNKDIQKRWVEITVVFHVLKGLTEMRERGEVLSWNITTIPHYQDRIFICNYRFVKEYTKGAESDWTANIVNHFKPMEMPIEKQV